MASSSSDLLAPPSARFLALRYLACALVLLAVSAALTITLTRRAVERRVEGELLQTARLLGGKGFPLSDPALRQIADYIDAEVIALSAEGRVLASSSAALEESADDLSRGLPSDGLDAPRVLRAELREGVHVSLGVAPLPGRGGSVLVVYPDDLVASEAQSSYLPLLGLALLIVPLALGLGVFAERRNQRERQAAMTRLLASVAHEVRNPLGAIRSLATSLRRSSPPESEAPLELIASEAERLTLLVEGLRAVGLPVRTLRSPVDANAQVHATAELLAHQLRHRRVKLSLDLQAEVSVLADPAQLRQILVNLVLNGADAQPRGGEVRLAGRERDGVWELSVEDDGPGVSPDVRARLFQPFVTTKAKGVGVGLYLSRRLTEANGGSLTLATGLAAASGAAPEAEGPGACFVLRWPLADDSAGRPSSSEAAPEREASGPLPA